jgi:hypothetical protein
MHMTRWDAAPFEQACIWCMFALTIGGLGYLYCVIVSAASGVVV